MIDFLVLLLTLVAMLVFVATTVGLIRFPDFYTRMHAAGKGDTMAAALMLLGLVVYEFEEFSWPHVHIAAKILFVFVFILLANPTATHAIIDAGYETESRPWRRGGDGEEEIP